jgi:hypothetical protein
MDTWVVPTSTKHISFRERAWGSAKPGGNEIDDPSLIQMLPRLTAGSLGAVPLGDKPKLIVRRSAAPLDLRKKPEIRRTYRIPT